MNFRALSHLNASKRLTTKDAQDTVKRKIFPLLRSERSRLLKQLESRPWQSQYQACTNLALGRHAFKQVKVGLPNISMI